MLTRREFSATMLGTLAPEATTAGPELRLDDPSVQAKYDSALRVLRANIVRVHQFDAPVLIEGGVYGGVWLECAPQEGLVYAPFDAAVARANHEIFFDLQRDDGYLPCWVRQDRIGSAQIQMVVPVAATAWDLYRTHAMPRDFLEKAYRACGRWDDWLARYRDTRKTGLCEAFCEYDTGHDGSPRFAGLPKACSDGDARICPKSDRLPVVAPDLSATVYGGRVALAAIARELGRDSDAQRWRAKAAATRRALARLYDSADAAWYDLLPSGQSLRIRGDATIRVLGEHVPVQEQFDIVWRRQVGNPKAFWAPYPLPSIALDDPAFSVPGRNSWGGASQALAALRAPRWMEHYGKRAELEHLMRRWVEAIVREPADFLQQLDPRTGRFTADRGGYSPCALVLVDFLWRLHGVRRDADRLHWNCSPGTRSVARLQTPNGIADLEQDGHRARLKLGAREIAVSAVAGRIETSLDGRILARSRSDGEASKDSAVD